MFKRFYPVEKIAVELIEAEVDSYAPVFSSRIRIDIGRRFYSKSEFRPYAGVYFRVIFEYGDSPPPSVSGEYVFEKLIFDAVRVGEYFSYICVKMFNAPFL